jgi:predicted dehydrogenase
MMSVAVVGARRKRQGTGAFVARAFAKAGAEVRAIVGTTRETVDDACRSLEERYGIRCRGYTSLGDCLERETLDAVAICSPPEAHAAALQLVASRGLHCLCEKPLLAGKDLGRRAEAIAGIFRERGRLLATITQWPYTLDAFRRLHPDVDFKRIPERFAMRLSPTRLGRDAAFDSLPHVLSMLHALSDRGTLCYDDGSPLQATSRAEEMVFRFDWVTELGGIVTEVELVHCPEPPRPASYAIDGRVARREVRLADYAMEFVAPDGRRVPLDDPLEALVADFVAKAERGRPTKVNHLAWEAASLEKLVDFVRRP